MTIKTDETLPCIFTALVHLEQGYSLVQQIYELPALLDTSLSTVMHLFGHFTDTDSLDDGALDHEDLVPVRHFPELGLHGVNDLYAFVVLAHGLVSQCQVGIVGRAATVVDLLQIRHTMARL